MRADVFRFMVCALFGLLVFGGTVFAQSQSVPRPPPRVGVPSVHPPLVVPPLLPDVVPSVAEPWFGGPLVPFWAATPWLSPLKTFNPWPTYGAVGDTVGDHPELVFKDGTTYIVRDYWRVDDELHFMTVEEGGTKSVEHTAPFTDLDVTRTSNADTARGFRFVLRDAPIEQWLRDHARTPAQR